MDAELAAFTRRAVISRLLEAWDARHDLRLGQLIANAVRASGRSPCDHCGCDPFYIDDIALIEAIEKLARG